MSSPVLAWSRAESRFCNSVLCDPEGFLYYSHNIFLMEITTERSSMEITTDQSFCGECEVVFGYDDIGDRELLTQEFDL